MHLTGFWRDFLSEMGNEPGAQKGDVTVHLVSPVDGMSHITGPSGALTLAAEAGSLIGAQFQVGGRRLFIPAGNIAGIIDAEADSEPAAHQQASPRRTAGRGQAPAS